MSISYTPHLLFSYGTLQDEKVQMQTFGRLLCGEKDAVIGFHVDTVKITDPHVLALSGKDTHLILRPTGNNEDMVDGTVFEITDEELHASDAYEVDDYKRIAANTRSGKTVWVYVEA